MPKTQNNNSDWSNRNPNSSNPFLLVPFSSGDLNGYEVNGGGAKIFVDVDEAYRQVLLARFDIAARDLLPNIEKYPGTLGGLVFRLREKAIAKSHRPMQVAREAGLVSAGHGNLDEMLVAGNLENLDILRRIIMERKAKSIIANLSAIVDIEPWSKERRNPDGIDALRESDAALVQLFRYETEEATYHSINSVNKSLLELGFSVESIRNSRGLPLLRIFNLRDADISALESLVDHPAIKLVTAEQRVCSPPNTIIALGNAGNIPALPAPDPSLPVVAVFDSGVSPNALQLAPWVISHSIFVLPPDTDHVHGTAVASLVAGSHALNLSHPWFPVTGCLVHNVAGLEAGGQGVGVIATRLRDALEDRPDIKIWNLSLGFNCECEPQQFSVFAQILDSLSDEFGVLFIVASGNYLGTPRRGWPDNALLPDRVSAPADSVRSLTVGSITHLDSPDTLVAENSPAPYSRRGPGPVFTPKPDVSHLGGGVHAPWNTGTASTLVLLPNGTLGGNFGTSFAAPIAASMAAHTWRALEHHQVLTPSPHLVKALMIHAAQLGSPNFDAIERRYYGAGVPRDVLASLYDSDDSFTLVFEAKLVAGAYRWRKDPYPIPSSLMQNGKFRGEIIITAAYNPPLDSNAGAEYIRSNVELSFGVLNGNRITGKVPLEREPGATTLEKAQVENGGKWAPVKVHRQKFPNGVSGDIWALQAQCSLRAFEPPLAEPISVSIIVTLRALDDNPHVHNEGVQALNAANWLMHPLPVNVPITV